MEHLYRFESKVAGIPCLIGVSWVDGKLGSFDRNAPSDLDYLGWFESEWEVLDRRGRSAPWLAKKLTHADEDRINFEVETHVKEAAYETRNR